VIYQLSGMLKDLNRLIKDSSENNAKTQELLLKGGHDLAQFSKQMGSIDATLKEGFRLSEV